MFWEMISIVIVFAMLYDWVDNYKNDDGEAIPDFMKCSFNYSDFIKDTRNSDLRIFVIIMILLLFHIRKILTNYFMVIRKKLLKIIKF
jgi:hypothetical protein